MNWVVENVRYRGVVSFPVHDENSFFFVGRRHHHVVVRLQVTDRFAFTRCYVSEGRLALFKVFRVRLRARVRQVVSSISGNIS